MVASNLNENRELARENNLQIQFFESGNSKSLQDSIRALLDSPALRLAQTRHNFGSIQRVRPAVTCDQYIEAFNRGLEKHKNPKRVSLTRRGMASG